jgi:hypothetical protein
LGTTPNTVPERVSGRSDPMKSSDQTSSPTYVTAETLYLPDSYRTGRGRGSIQHRVIEGTVAATLADDGSEWLATPTGVGITGSGGYTLDEALEAARAILLAEGYIADRNEAQRQAQAQAHARRHQFDCLPRDLAGTIARLREQGVLAPDRTLSKKWWARGLSKNRARRAMLGDKQCIGLIRRDSCPA